VFWRQKRHGVRVHRLPISRRIGYRVPDMLADKVIMPTVLKKSQERLDKNFSHEIDFMLSKL
jgi:hypothetical protein